MNLALFSIAECFIFVEIIGFMKIVFLQNHNFQTLKEEIIKSK